MKILIAPDSFKGSVSAIEFADIVSDALKDENIETIKMPLSDGGENMLDILYNLKGGTFKTFETFNSNMQKIKSKVLFINDEAYVESAQAIGLTLVDRLNIEEATSYGLGYLLKQVVNYSKNINVFLGGTATNDAGMGMLEFIDDIKASYTIYTDVTNPLLGENGATYTYAKQKGADENMQIKLEEKLKAFAKKDERYINTPGSGAAGGLGYFFMTYLNAKVESGIKYLLNEYKIYDLDYDLIITGEGKFDNQSMQGKVIGELIKTNKKVLVFTGINESNYEFSYQISEKIDFKNTKTNLIKKVKEVIKWHICN